MVFAVFTGFDLLAHPALHFERDGEHYAKRVLIACSYFTPSATPASRPDKKQKATHEIGRFQFAVGATIFRRIS